MYYEEVQSYKALEGQFTLIAFSLFLNWCDWYTC